MRLAGYCFALLVAAIYGATSADANEAIRWANGLPAAQQSAAHSGRLILVHFYSQQCVPCKKLSKNVFERKDVATLLEQKFVPVKIDGDQHLDLVRRWKVNAYPSEVILSPKGEYITTLEIDSRVNGEQYIEKLNQAHGQILANYPQWVAPPSMQVAAKPAVNYGKVTATAPSATSQSPTAQTPPTAAYAQQPQNSYPVNYVAPSAPHSGSPDWTRSPANSAASASPVSAVNESARTMQTANNSTSWNPTSVINPYAGPAANQQAQVSQPPQQVGSYGQQPAATPAWPTSSYDAQAAAQQAHTQQVADQQAQVVNPYVANQPAGNPQASNASGVTAPAVAGNPALANHHGLFPSGTAGPQAASAGGQIAHQVAHGHTAANAFGVNNQPMSDAFTQASAQVHTPPMPPQAEIQRQASAPQASAPLAFDGYCTVSMVEQFSRPADQRQLIKGDVRWGAIHRGQTYLFASQQNQQMFLANPDAYSPMFSGNDLVLRFNRGMTVPGSRAFGLACDNRIYLFATQESANEFARDPVKYLQLVQQAEAPTATQWR